MKNNKMKVITIVALIIAVIALSIGFAAFASTLNIQTGANINPTDNFSVKFSKEDTSLVENQSVLPTQTSTATGDSATINNNDNPTITGLSASFTGPGQKVEYIFYVRNMGPYDAYLTDVRFNNAEGGTSFKKCEATGSNPVSNANDMCEYITFKLELAGLATPLTSTLDISSVIGNNYVVNKSLTPELGNTNSKMVKVTIEYPDESPYADGSFNVSFGNVEMVYATLAGYVPPTPTPASSDQEIIQGVQLPDYVVNSQGVITKYNGSGGDITIPSTSPVYVESEYEYVNLSGCIALAQTPDAGSMSLEQATSACEDIKTNVESGHPELVNQQFYSGLKDLGLITQGYISTGQNVTITEIGNRAFPKGLELTSVEIPSSITVIGSYAFQDINISSVRIYNNQSNVSLGFLAFENGQQIVFNDNSNYVYVNGS